MWGFWKDGAGGGWRGSRVAGLTGGLAKLSFKALRLPEGRGELEKSRQHTARLHPMPTCTTKAKPMHPSRNFHVVEDHKMHLKHKLCAPPAQEFPMFPHGTTSCADHMCSM